MPEHNEPQLPNHFDLYMQENYGDNWYRPEQALGLYEDDPLSQITPITSPTTPPTPTEVYALGMATEIGVAWQFFKLLGQSVVRTEIRRATLPDMSDAVSLGEFQGFYLVDDNNNQQWAASTTRYYQARTIAQSGQTNYFSPYFPVIPVSGTTLAAGSTNTDLQNRVATFAAKIQGLHLLASAIPSVAFTSAVGGGGGSVTSAVFTSVRNTLSNQVSVLSQAVSVISQQVSALSQSVSSQAAALSVRIDTQSQAISVLSQQVSVISQAFSALSQAVSIISVQVVSALSIANAASNAASIVSQALSSQAAALSVRIDTQSQAISVLSNQVSVLSQAVSVLSQSVSVLSQTVSTLAGLSNQVSILSQSVSVLSQAVSALSQQVSVLSQAISVVSNALSNEISNRTSAISLARRGFGQVIRLSALTSGNSTVNLTADAAQFYNPTTKSRIYVESVGVTGNDVGLSAGVDNGRDQASIFTSSVWLHFYLVLDGTTVKSRSSLNAPLTGPTLQGTESAWAYCGAVRRDASNNLIPTIIRGAYEYYDLGDAGVTRMLAAGTATVFTSVALSTVVPPNAELVNINAILYLTHNAAPQDFFCYLRPAGSTATGFIAVACDQQVANINIGARTIYALPHDSSQRVDYRIQLPPATSGGVYLDIVGFRVANGDV